MHNTYKQGFDLMYTHLHPQRCHLQITTASLWQSFELIKCTLKFFTVTVNGKPQNTSLDHLKLAHLEPTSRTPTAGTTTSMPPGFMSMAASSVSPIRTMRSGRHVHSPDRFASWFICHQVTGGGVLWCVLFLCVHELWQCAHGIYYYYLFAQTHARVVIFGTTCSRVVVCMPELYSSDSATFFYCCSFIVGLLTDTHFLAWSLPNAIAVAFAIANKSPSLPPICFCMGTILRLQRNRDCLVAADVWSRKE